MSIKTELELDPSKAIRQAGEAGSKIGEELNKGADSRKLSAQSNDYIKQANRKDNGGNAGYGLQKIAQFADDAQYGLKGVTNNISDTLMALGAGAGLAGGATIAAVAVQTLLVPALEKMVGVENDAAKAARKAAEAQAQSANEIRRKSEALKEAKSVGDAANRAWDGEIAGLRSINQSYDEGASVALKLANAREKLALAKIDAGEASSADKVRQRFDVENKGIEERQALEKDAAQNAVTNSEKALAKSKAAYEETIKLLARQKEAAALNWGVVERVSSSGGNASMVQLEQKAAEKADKEAAGLQAKADAIRKNQEELERINTEANKRLKASVLEESLIMIEKERNSIEVSKKLKEINDERTSALTDSLLKQVDAVSSAAQKEGKALQEMAAKNNEQLAKKDRDSKIAEAEASGKKSKTERLKREASIEDKTKEYTDLGLSKEDAQKRAEKDVRISEDAAQRQKTGRSRIHTAENQSSKPSDPSKRVGDPQFANLDKLQALRNPTPINEPLQAPREAPKPKSNESGLEKVMKEFITLAVPALKKFAAEPLRKS